MTKSITFRATKKAIEKINETMSELNKEGKRSDKTQAILYLIERQPSEPQLEHLGEEKYFKIPSFLYCPDMKTWVSKDTLLFSKETGCENCKKKKSCPAWRLKELF